MVVGGWIGSSYIKSGARVRFLIFVLLYMLGEVDTLPDVERGRHGGMATFGRGPWVRRHC